MNILEHHPREALPYKYSYLTFPRPVQTIFKLGDPYPQLPVTRYFVMHSPNDSKFVEKKLYIEHWTNNGLDGHFEMICLGYFVFDITDEYVGEFNWTPEYDDVYHDAMEFYEV
jgi:hypothetical protein